MAALLQAKEMSENPRLGVNRQLPPGLTFEARLSRDRIPSRQGQGLRIQDNLEP